DLTVDHDSMAFEHSIRFDFVRCVPREQIICTWSAERLRRGCVAEAEEAEEAADQHENNPPTDRRANPVPRADAFPMAGRRDRSNWRRRRELAPTVLTDDGRVLDVFRAEWTLLHGSPSSSVSSVQFPQRAIERFYVRARGGRSHHRGELDIELREIGGAAGIPDRFQIAFDRDSARV